MTGHATPPADVSDRNLLTDRPELYEAQFPDPQRLAARWAEDVLCRHAAGSRLLDAGCGTGRDAAWLHHHGRARRVTGFDLSPAMLAHARRHHPGPEYLAADLRGFDLGRCVFDAVLCLDSALLYCHTNGELAAFLASCRRHLAPGGLLIAEMRNGAYFLGRTDLLDTPRTRSLTWQGTTLTSVTTLWLDRAAQLLRRRRVWTADDGSPPAEQHSAWRLLFPQELRHLLRTAGFEVLELHDGPGPRTDPPWRPGSAAPPPDGPADGDRLHLVARLA
ncbi:class I SAM-dependent methyltransferase [Streptomyces sp. YIM 98790]|uniref:class I SAM-dependent DNA methyltransferase n=1 Tax=Streptomyces sp. YIM 98790 TaxID=2689077 RepID=UPI001A9DD920|nr:class I SAM-dependent methyltransferase [Streptomyces sp. YIM 98790]